MGDNQQQQQMNVQEKRPVGDLLLLFVGGAAIALTTIWASHWLAPEIWGDDRILGPRAGGMPG